MTEAAALTPRGADRLAVAVLVGSASLWGLSWWPLKALAGMGLSGPQLAALSYGLLGLAGLPWLLRQRPQWRRQAAMLGLIALVGGWGNAAFTTALVLGDVVRVMLLFYLTPVWSVLGGRLFLGETVTRRRAAAMALALGGAFMVLGGSAVFDAPPSAVDLLALTAGMGFAGNNILSRAAQEVPLASKSIALCLGCALVSLPLMLLVPQALPVFTWPLAMAVVAFAFGGLLLVITTWQWSVTRLEAGRSGVIAIAELLVAVISATWIGDAELAPREWVGGALIAAAALLEATDSGAAAPGIQERKACAPSS